MRFCSSAVVVVMVVVRFCSSAVVVVMVVVGSGSGGSIRSS